MPVKVKCKACEKVSTAPDKFRGKTVKCPKCKAPLKIPSGKKRPAGSGQKRRRPAEVEAPAAGGDLFGNLDLRAAEDRKVKLCPKCATQVDPEDIECPNCGVNVATGVLSAKQRKLRERKGPDPDEYWGKVYGDAWKFTKAHWSLALKTGLMYCFLGAMFICAARTCNWCYVGKLKQIVDEINNSQGKIAMDSGRIKITATKDAPTTFLNKRYTKSEYYPHPRLMAVIPLENPPFYFWAFMTAVFGLALSGWMWFVGTNIVRLTMDGKKKVKKLQGDFFGYISLGIKAFTWPLILWYPLLGLVGGIGAVSPIGAAIFGGVLALITLPIFPVCMVHMCQPYVYKAYLLVPMLRITLKNFGAAAYWAIAALLANIVLLGVAGAGGAMANRISAEYTKFMTNTAQKWIASNVMAPSGEWGQFTFQELPSLFFLSLVALLPIALVTGFATMFMMRGIGHFGRYFHNQLELMTESDKGKPAGFGPRYLAFIIDSFLWPLTPILVATDRILQLINLFSVLIIVLVAATFPPELKPVLLPIVIVCVALVWLWTYFAVQEAGYEQCTTGKNSMNIIVTDMEGNRISRKMATKRLLLKWIGAIPFYAGWILCFFDKQKGQAWHDKTAKTMVVWRGESEQSRL